MFGEILVRFGGLILLLNLITENKSKVTAKMVRHSSRICKESSIFVFKKILFTAWWQNSISRGLFTIYFLGKVDISFGFESDKATDVVLVLTKKVFVFQKNSI